MSDTSNASLAPLARQTWDVVVIGAGPAGAVSARQLARQGMKTLLLDAKPYPRFKVCGGSLNSRALSVLRQCGLESVLHNCRGSHINEFHLIVGRQSELFHLPTGMAVSRATFDNLLARAALEAGATFIDYTQGIVRPQMHSGRRDVTLRRHGEQVSIRARVVVCADGLSRSSVKLLDEFRSDTALGSRVGVGMVARDDGAACPAGRITMVVTNEGYVGLTRIDERNISIAAALDPHLLRNSPSEEVLLVTLARAGVLDSSLARPEAWQGTPPLTSRPNRVASERLFMVGDSSGYVEPFTGEGIAAALEGAVAVVPLAVEACAGWKPALAARWEETHRRVVYDKQTTCRRLAWVLRYPAATSGLLTLCRWFPPAARHVMDRVNHPSPGRRSAGTGHL
jgi:flavin-dependent dehydrogenase